MSNTMNERTNSVTVEQRNLSTGILISGLPYQRHVDEKAVTKLIETWDERLFEPLIVSYRDGLFYLVDGQHRSSAVRRMNNGQDVIVPCKIYLGLTYEEEAELCYKLDKARKPLTMSQTTKLLMESGSDPEIAEIQRLLSANGFVWALGKFSPGNYEIVAARAVIKAYRLLGSASFDRMLHIMAEAWHGVPVTLKANFISGMALFLKTYETELKDTIAIRHLSRIDPEEVTRRSNGDMVIKQVSLRYARTLWKKYNAQPGRKLTYRFQE